jgi:hypothetical protein
MEHDYLMNISSAIFFLCYIPELYANYKNQNANVYNMPEKVLMLIGSGFAFSFAIMKEDIALMSNYGPILALDCIALLMRLYYVLRNNAAPVPPSSEPSTPPSESSTPPPEVYIE